MRMGRRFAVVPVVVAVAVLTGGLLSGVASAGTRAAAPTQNDNGKKPSLDQTQKSQAKRTAAYTRTARLAIADIQAYWAATFPEVYGAKYQPIPPNRIYAAHPGGKLPPCQGQ